MHEHRKLVAELGAHLADRFEERQRLDVAHRATDLDQADVGATGAVADAVLDLVGDVRDDLHGAAEVVAAALLVEHVAVDLAGGDVRQAAGLATQETLVVAEVEIGLRTVLGDEHFAVLERAHGARVDVDIRVELDHRHGQPARFENRAKARRSDALAERRHDAAGDENKTSLTSHEGWGLVITEAAAYGTREPLGKSTQTVQPETLPALCNKAFAPLLRCTDSGHAPSSASGLEHRNARTQPRRHAQLLEPVAQGLGPRAACGSETLAGHGAANPQRPWRWGGAFEPAETGRQVDGLRR